MNKMKRTIICSMLCLTNVYALTNQTYAASKRNRALKAYNQILSKRTINWGRGDRVSLRNSKFALVSLDKDSIPELVVNSYYTDHAQGAYALFAYHNGKVKHVDGMMDGLSYYPRKNMVRPWHGGTDGLDTCYLTFKKARTVPYLWKSDELYDMNGDGKVSLKYYKGVSGRKRISKKTFTKLLKSKVGSTKAKKPKYHKNTKANRRKYLK